MMLIRVPLQSVAAVTAAAVPPSPSHRIFAYIDTDTATTDKTSQSSAAVAASSIKVSINYVIDDDADARPI